MKRTSIFIVLLLFVCSSCKTPQYIPVETLKTEYRDKIVKDSVFLYDSIFIKQKDDTLILERYRYLYKNKIIRDSILKTDTISVPYPVEVIKEVKKPLTGWQNFQIWCGHIALAILLLVGIYLVLKLKKNYHFSVHFLLVKSRKSGFFCVYTLPFLIEKKCKFVLRNIAFQFLFIDNEMINVPYLYYE